MESDYQVSGTVEEALLTLKLHRGDGMTLVAMNWKQGKPPRDFVGFSIEYREPEGDRFFPVSNRIAFPQADGSVNPNTLSSLLSPIQKFRWVHFPRFAELQGKFTYRVKPVFMNRKGALSYGVAQKASIELRRETHPGKLNVAFARGFISSQAFVDKFVSPEHGIKTLIPTAGKDGLHFSPTHPDAKRALSWMGFEARDVILEVLDQAVRDNDAKVEVVAYDLNQREVFKRLLQLGARLSIIIDDSDDHAASDSAETIAAGRLAEVGATVKRHHMSDLQHNKTITIDSPRTKLVVCGSTNFTWRAMFVQNNNAVILRGPGPVKVFRAAFAAYQEHDSVVGFGQTLSAQGWTDLGLDGIEAKVTFSPHAKEHAVLDSIAQDVLEGTTSSLLYSLAFIAQTKGSIRKAITEVTARGDAFVYGIADREVDGIELQTPDGNLPPVFPEALSGNLPEPFKSEPTGLSGGVGTRMHHKFLVIDFDKPTARVYLGSYNFSNAADGKNGENLLLIKDRRIAVSYMIEALRIFDHYHFRVKRKQAQEGQNGQSSRLQLKTPPKDQNESTWFDDDYANAQKTRDRELFA